MTTIKPPPSEREISGDLLIGAKGIAAFLFGPGETHVRRVYYLIEQRELPAFRVGVTIYARRSRLLAWVSKQENTPSASDGVDVMEGGSSAAHA